MSLEDMSPEEKAALRGLLHTLRESATRREPLLPEEKELVLSAAGVLKSRGVWVAAWLLRMASAEIQIQKKLGVSDDRWPTIEKFMPLLSGSLAPCEWPGSDYIYAPSVLDRLGFLRQQNDPWVGPGRIVTPPLPNDPETALSNEDAQDAMWRMRLFVGANRDTETRLASRKELDQLVESLRFNSGRSGRRHPRTVAVFIEKYLYVYYCAFHGLLKKGQRETPRRYRGEDSILEFLVKSGYPRYLTARLAQELSEHRQRRRGSGIQLTLKDRAALMVVDLEGKRGKYGLPEPLGPDDPLEEDTSTPLSVTMRKPPLGPFRTPAAEERYERALKGALRWARARVRQAKAMWISETVAPKSDKK